MKHIYIYVFILIQLSAQLFANTTSRGQFRSREELWAWDPLTIIHNSEEIVVIEGQSAEGMVALKDGAEHHTRSNRIGHVIKFVVSKSLKGNLQEGHDVYILIENTPPDFAPVLSQLRSGVAFLVKVEDEERSKFFYSFGTRAPIPDPLYKFSVDLLEQWKAWLQVPSGRADDKELYNRLNRILSRNVGLTFDRDVLVEYIQYLVELASLSADALAGTDLEGLDRYAKRIVTGILQQAQSSQESNSPNPRTKESKSTTEN